MPVHTVKYGERDGVTAFALGTEGVDARALSDWSHAAPTCPQLLFPGARQRPALHACGFDTLIVRQEAEVYLPVVDQCGAYANLLRHMLRRSPKRARAVVSVSSR